MGYRGRALRVRCVLKKLAEFDLVVCKLLDLVDDVVDPLVGLSTLIHNMVCNLMVVADSGNVEANPFDELLQNFVTEKSLGLSGIVRSEKSSRGISSTGVGEIALKPGGGRAFGVGEGGD